MVPESRFGLSHLRIHPVWARFYEPDDANVACSWGVDRATFQGLLDRSHSGNDHAMFPVLSLDPLPDDVLNLYVLASFRSPAGEVFDGYVTEDAGFICIFLSESTWFSFGRRTTGAFFDQEMRRFELAGGRLPLFPLDFSTPYRLVDGSTLRGVFFMD